GSDRQRQWGGDGRGLHADAADNCAAESLSRGETAHASAGLQPVSAQPEAWLMCCRTPAKPARRIHAATTSGERIAACARKPWVSQCARRGRGFDTVVHTKTPPGFK